MANFSTNSEFLAVLSCSPLSPSNLRISIIQQSYGLAIASTELCELVSNPTPFKLGQLKRRERAYKMTKIFYLNSLFEIQMLRILVDFETPFRRTVLSFVLE